MSQDCWNCHGESCFVCDDSQCNNYEYECAELEAVQEPELFNSMQVTQGVASEFFRSLRQELERSSKN